MATLAHEYSRAGYRAPGAAANEYVMSPHQTRGKTWAAETQKAAPSQSGGARTQDQDEDVLRCSSLTDLFLELQTIHRPKAFS